MKTFWCFPLVSFVFLLCLSIFVISTIPGQGGTLYDVLGASLAIGFILLILFAMTLMGICDEARQDKEDEIKEELATKKLPNNIVKELDKKSNEEEYGRFDLMEI